MVETLESGDLAFFYRARVDEEQPGGLEDDQQLSLATRARGGRWRLRIVGLDLPARDESATSADVFDQLKTRRHPHPLQSLSEGFWQ